MESKVEKSVELESFKLVVKNLMFELERTERHGKVSLLIDLSNFIRHFRTEIVLFNFGPSFPTSFFRISGGTFQLKTFRAQHSQLKIPNFFLREHDSFLKFYIQFHAWRVFVVLCALPSVCAATALTFLYESPRWQLRAGFTKQALITLQKVHEINYSARGDTVHQLEADLSAEPQPVDPGLTEISRATDSFMSRISVRFLTALDEILTGTKLIFDVSSPVIIGFYRLSKTDFQP